MRVLIVTTQVPFVTGGAEILAQGLLQALRAAGHEADLTALPFKWYPAERIVDQMLACRLYDVRESVGVPIDRVIALKFPAYLVAHPNKVAWLVHQHRQAYDLWNHPLGDLHFALNGPQVRSAIRQADCNLLPKCRAIHTIAGNVSRRLEQYCGIASQPLYHPPSHAEAFHCSPAEDYLFFPSRLSSSKRQGLVLEALAHTREPVRVRFAGAGADGVTANELEAKTRKLRLTDRVQWLGSVSEAEKRTLYARSLGVIYPPIDEDYGYVTLEAMLASKPVVTCADSGGPLEFVIHEQTGYVCQPTAEELAEALDRLWRNRSEAQAWGLAGRRRYDSFDLSWERVVHKLVA